MRDTFREPLVTLQLNRLDGTSTGFTGSISIPANGQVASFLNQLPGSPLLGVTPFQGVLRIASTSPIAVVGLRGRYNERNEFLVTTTPPADEAAPITRTELVFPHFANSGGYTTQFILISPSAAAPPGTLRFFSQSGQAWALRLR